MNYDHTYTLIITGRNYGRAFLLIATILSVASVLENIWDDTIFYVWCCALACGIQNGLTSKYSGNVVRTTHLTGATTGRYGLTLDGWMEGWELEKEGCRGRGAFLLVVMMTD